MQTYTAIQIVFNNVSNHIMIRNVFWFFCFVYLFVFLNTLTKKENKLKFNCQVYYL